MTLKPFSYQENYIVMVYVCILLLYFSFWKGFNHAYGIQSISGIYIFSLPVHLAVCKSFCSFVPSSICQLLDQSFALKVFIAYISETTWQISFIFGSRYHYSINVGKKPEFAAMHGPHSFVRFGD